MAMGLCRSNNTLETLGSFGTGPNRIVYYWKRGTMLSGEESLVTLLLDDGTGALSYVEIHVGALQDLLEELSKG